MTLVSGDITSVEMTFGRLDRKPSKLTERVVANQIKSHMIKNNLFPQLKSAYCSYHSIETSMLKAMNDLVMNMSKRHVSLLLLLNLSAVFDSVDDRIFLNTLRIKLGVCVTALSWGKSYLEGRSQGYCINDTLSQPFHFKWSVPQSSCLGPLLFTIYTCDFLYSGVPFTDFTSLRGRHAIVYVFSPKLSAGEAAAVTATQNCIRYIRQWMCETKLMLDDKIEFLMVGSRKELAKVSIDECKYY